MRNLAELLEDKERLDWPGGKGNIYQFLINRIPPHKIYVEGFLGGGAVMWNKRPAELNVGADLDEEAVTWWREYLNLDDRAGRFGGNWWVILKGDGIRVMRAYDSRRTFHYVDPPYPIWTRNMQRPLYEHEMMTGEEHQELLMDVRELEGMVMISSYPNWLYDGVLSDWYTAECEARDRAGNVRIEKIWMNYEPPDKLHDYQYLGHDFRERERIKRKRKRWVSNFADMPALERWAFLAEIERRGLV